MSEIFADIARALAAAGLPAPREARAVPRDKPILFFSGGSALKDVARYLSGLTPNTVHIVTTFDSGGSTAEIRRVFNAPAIGDLRLRLSSLSGCDFFERRLGAGTLNGLTEFDSIINESGGAGGLSENFRERLIFFRQLMPQDFDLNGAALGNLIIAADYLRNGRSLYESTTRIAAELGAAGRVLPVSEDSVHLAVRLESGEVLAGQHRFTGKHGHEPSSPVREMFFCRAPGDLYPVAVRPGPHVLEAIQASGLICYPVGSFYSSVLANLRVGGVGAAVRRSRAIKLYLPNPGRDPESAHLSLEEQLEALCRAAAGDISGQVGVAPAEAGGLIDFLLVDSRAGEYRGGLPHAWCERHGVKIIDYRFVEHDSAGLAVISPERSSLILQALSGLESGSF